MLKNKKLMAMLTTMLAFVGLSEPPIVDGKIAFEEAEAEKLKAVLTDATFNEAITAFNKDLAEANQAEDIRASVQNMLKELEIPTEELNQIIKESGGENGDVLTLMKNLETSLTAWKAEQAQIVKKLGNQPDDDTPEAIIKKAAMQQLKHSATHLFGSNKGYDAIENDRPWNKAAAAGLTVSATDYSETVINKLNGDAELYFRENPTEIMSLHRDNFGLPDFWKKRLNVSDRVASAAILTAEITQGRKLNWLPKNKQEIEAEEGKIYPVQIDAQWEGYQLQEIESSWLNMMNKEGSQPEKMSFVRFLVAELMKRARVEDRISTLNGIFVQTPDNATSAGKFINRQNGLFYQLYKGRDIDQKYRAFAMGDITPANVYDYYHSDNEANLGLLKRLPQDVLAQTNLVCYIHHKVWTWYKAKYKEINGTNMDYKGMHEYFEDYPNVRVVTFVDQENPSFTFITFDDNIEILENIPAEKSTYRFQTLLRKIYLLADYKLGVRLIHIGRKIKANDPDEFKVQSVWSNDVPIFKEDRFIPVFDDETGIVKVNYKNIQVDESWKTNITEFTGLTPGTVVKVMGNTGLAAAKNIVDGAKVSLVGNASFALASGFTITFYVKSDYTVQELSRTSALPTNPSTDVNFSGTTIDANAGSIFRFTGLADAALADIDNGSNDKVIRIYGNDVTDVDFTVDDISGLLVVGTAIVLSAADKYVDLVKVSGVWYVAGTNV